MGLLPLIAGIVLAANGQWFHGAHAIGVVLIVIGALALLWQVAFMVFVGREVRDTRDELRGTRGRGW